MKRRLVAAGALIAAVLGSAAAAAPAEEVTLRLDRSFDPALNRINVRFLGTISSGKAGEYVTVLEQRCGARFSTAVAGATTGTGGSWEAAPSTYYLHEPLKPGTFRARWKSHLSRPVTFRPPLPIHVRRQRSGRFLATVPAHTTLRGELLELQRLAGGRWTLVKHLRLSPRAWYGGSYFAGFAVRTRGWTLRVAASDETAAPCYAAGATWTFRS